MQVRNYKKAHVCFPVAAVPTLSGCKGTREKGLCDYTCFLRRGRQNRRSTSRQSARGAGGFTSQNPPKRILDAFGAIPAKPHDFFCGAEPLAG